MSNRFLMTLGLAIILVNMCLVVFNVVRGGWWYTPINVYAMGVVVWSLHRHRPRARP